MELAGLVPHATLVAFGTAMPQDSRYPPVYGGSTLEDSTAVADLCGVLAAHHGRDGMPAVLQPNYIVAALACEPLAGAEEYSGRLLARLDQQNGWFRYELPYLPRLYARRGLLPAMRAARRGHIVRISSAGGRIATMTLSAYCASKFALEGFAEALALEVSPLGVFIFAVDDNPNGVLDGTSWFDYVVVGVTQ